MDELDDTHWIAAGRSTPAQSLARIKSLCGQFPDLFSALFAIAATHQQVSREMLALAVKQFRPDTESLSKEDVMGLLTSIATGGHQAFDAVLNTRKNARRKVSGNPFVKE